MNYLLVFIANSLKYCKSGYIIGIYNDEKEEACKSLFILGVKSSIDNLKTYSYSTIGYYSNNNESFANIQRKNTFICLSYYNEFIVNSIRINNEFIKLSECHIIVYDDRTLIKSELFLPIDYRNDNEQDHFKSLTYHLKLVKQQPVNFVSVHLKVILFFKFIIEYAYKLTSKFYRILSLTTIGVHYHQSLESLLWLLETYRKDGKVTLKTGNYLLAVISDLLLGYIVLSILADYQNSTDLFNLLALHTKHIVHSIELTINWLMGSPWGVKLNYPLNYILGNFFLYNLQLWWNFLGIVRPLLEVSFFAFLKLGVLGVSHQIAIAADIFSVVSFHVYCIYIYAARLYHWQISGLHSLSRIFLGRKRNPEPGKVDSCPYTTEQLFVGTICFTVLLFLLPTTLVYYTVFTLMRLGVNIVAGIMSRARYYIQILPLYSTLVWILYPEFTTTTMKLTPVNGLSNAGIVTLTATRATTNWCDMYQRCKPDVIKELPQVNWREIGWKILVGNLIYPL
ncbi:hypothetical protein O3M35_013091 [Rhynocoris fuscipes]|uniref:Phosphatidylinositol N-acetylglucosaminyltransferase subunit Q n=1 Tax=Rhynocoris fuscipes TaxID=488301 RepID=A0AAW1CF66_9HEMI